METNGQSNIDDFNFLDDKLFDGMSDEELGPITKTSLNELVSSENSENPDLTKPNFHQCEDSTTSDTMPTKPVVFKIMGDTENLKRNMYSGKSSDLHTQRDHITQKESHMSNESSEESIPSDDCSDEEVEIIGEKPGSGSRTDEADSLAALEDERPPSDEESAEEIDSDDDVEELSSDDEDGESESEDIADDEEGTEGEDEGAGSSHDADNSILEVCSSEEANEDTKEPKSSANLKKTKFEKTEAMKSLCDVNGGRDVPDSTDQDLGLLEADKNAVSKIDFQDLKAADEDKIDISEITFNDLRAAEEDKSIVDQITFNVKDEDTEDKHSKGLNTDKLSEGNKEKSSALAEESTEKKVKKAEEISSGKKKRKRKREKDPNKKEKKKGSKRRKKDKSSDDTPKQRKQTFGRKNIRKIIKDQDLDEETVRAQKEELERKQRLQEKIERLKQSQLQSLLEDEDDFADEMEEESSKPPDTKSRKIEAEVVEISSDEDEVHMVSADSAEEPGEEIDPHNSGSHVNDAMNQPDCEGRVLVNVGHPPNEPDIFLAPLLAANVKPHQIGGIRFLYDNLVESLQQYKGTNGFGCILAHSMGLGKTLQVISFVDVFLRFTEGQRVLIIVPVNTLQNWMNEFNMWLPPEEKAKPDDGIWPRQFKVCLISDSHKNNLSRSKVVEEWYKHGGCLLMGYEMYRLLTSKRVAMSRPKKSKGNEPVLIDLVEEEKNTELLISLKSALVNPGPDLIICDEGHRIKNSCAGISQCLKNIKTRRRVVLTGYPLQNNLQEYWCMVDFTRPNFLGTKTEFANMFERPIMNGQCMDSTPQDHRLMRFRAHVLHSLLEGFVQRRSHDVLRRALPPKEEHVILVKMSANQRSLYKAFMDSLEQTDMGEMASANPLKAFSVCCKIWNHPDILNQIVEQRRMEDNDLDIEETKMDGEANPSGAKSGTKKGKGKGSAADFKKSASNPELTMPFLNDKQTTISYEWAHEPLKGYKPGVTENSGKLVLLLSILEKSLEIGDKVLLFSQSLFTLTLIEDYLGKVKLPNSDEYWAKNKSYYRLDGSTVSQDREKLISQFNAPDNTSVHLFLLSTRAGCLGINLIGANRVVVFDASWNPCHDCQAVCRVYRYGQMKNCYVYRFVSDLTMEKKIYDRQINKQGMSNRVVDELNPINCLTRRQVDVLLQYQDADPPAINPSMADDKQVEDPVLYRLIKRHHKWITKIPFSHESLLIDRKDQRLTMTEKKLAHQGYEMEKKMSNSYSRPSYSAFYPRAGPTIRPMTIRRPIASVRPMMQPPVMPTPVPMQPRGSGPTTRPTLVGEVSRPPGTTIIGAGASKISTAPPALLKPGVSVQQIKLKSDIPIPNSTTADGSLQRIPAGENVLVIKTPKGVYIRTPGGKIFAVRSAPKEAESSESSMQDIITRSVAAATKIQEETVSKPSAVTVTVSASSLSKTSEHRGITTQKVISITPKISIVKSTVQKLKADSSSGGISHGAAPTDTSSVFVNKSTVNISMIKSPPIPALSKPPNLGKDSSSDDDIAVLSLKKGRKQKKKEAAIEKCGENSSRHVSKLKDQPKAPQKQNILTVSQRNEDSQVSKNLVSKNTDNTKVSQKQSKPTALQKHGNLPVSRKFNSPLIAQNYDMPVSSPTHDNPPVSQKNDNCPTGQKPDSCHPGSSKYSLPFSPKQDNTQAFQKPENLQASQKNDNFQVSHKYNQPVSSQNYENNQNFHLPQSLVHKYDSTPASQRYDSVPALHKYDNSSLGSGPRGFPFYAPSFNGPQYMPWMAPSGSGDQYGYPPSYGWGMSHPMQQQLTSNSPQTSHTYTSPEPTSDMPAISPLGGSQFPTPFPSNAYPSEPYYMSTPPPMQTSSHTPAAPPSYNAEQTSSQPATAPATYNPSLMSTAAALDTMNADSNSLDSLVKDFDIDLTSMQNSADIHNFGL